MRAHRSFAAAMLAATVAACGGGGGGSSGPKTVTITQSQATVAGTGISSLVSTSITSYLGSTASDPTGGGGGKRAAPLGLSLFAGAPAAMGLPSSPAAPCPATSDNTDSDHDGVPNNETFTFTLPACQGVSGTVTVQITGAATVSDPAPNVSGPDYNGSYSGLELDLSNSANGATASGKFDGPITVVKSGSGGTQNLGLTIHVSGTGIPTQVLTNSWASSYTPDENFTLSAAVLPPGTYATSGQTVYKMDNDTFTFTVSTPTPLTVNPGECNGSATLITAGEVDATVQNGNGAFVRMTWLNCGAPTIVLVSTS